MGRQQEEKAEKASSKVQNRARKKKGREQSPILSIEKRGKKRHWAIACCEGEGNRKGKHETCREGGKTEEGATRHIECRSGNENGRKDGKGGRSRCDDPQGKKGAKGKVASASSG